MKNIIILAAGCALFAACSSNTNEGTTTPTSTTVTTDQPIQVKDTPLPVPVPDTTGPLNKRSGAINGRRTDQSVETRADNRSTRTTTRSATTVSTTPSTAGSATTSRDGDVLIVKKGQEEDAMRQKIHENNSIDGGGQ